MVLNSIAVSFGMATIPTFKPHVVISNLEHGSVDLAARNLRRRGQIGEF